MAWSFGDGFDLYAAPADAINGYWDSGGSFVNTTLATGRFAGSRAFNIQNNAGSLTKSSGVNDAVHHIVCAFLQTATISGTTVAGGFQIFDGATVQCSIHFRSDGAILFYSGTAGGTLLDTYTGAFPLANTWYAFEFEVVINNTTGSWAVRKNGNSVNDHSLGSLNTRGGTTNNYANKLLLGMWTTLNGQTFDDLFWRSDASSVAWLGDIRCYTRMPASDASVQFSRAGSTTQANVTTNSITNLTAGQGWYMPFTPSVNGTVTTATFSVGAGLGFTGNVKCSIYNSSGTAPGTPIASATPTANPVAGTNVFTFSAPPTVTAGTLYWVAFCCDTTTAGNNLNWRSAASGAYLYSGTYAAFPPSSPSSPTSTNFGALTVTWTITPNANYLTVNEPQQDGTTSYVNDSTVGHTDFYNLGSITSTPATTIAVTTRGYAQKSDAGNRQLAVQIKSGSTTVASPSLVLSTSGFQWAWRTDIVDPNTGAAWTAAAVNAAQIGPSVVS